MIKSRIPLFKGLRQGLSTMAGQLKCFCFEGGRYKKMINYPRFREIVESFEGSPIDLMAVAARFNSVLLSSWLCLLLYPQGGALRLIYLAAEALFYLLHELNLLFLKEVKANIGFLRQIVEEIDRTEIASAATAPFDGVPVGEKRRLITKPNGCEGKGAAVIAAPFPLSL